MRTVQLPRVLTMLASMVPVSTFLGSRFGPDHGFPEAWQKNDGAVNTVSQPSDGHGEWYGRLSLLLMTPSPFRSTYMLSGFAS